MTRVSGHVPKRQPDLVEMMRADFPDKHALSARMGTRRMAYLSIAWNPPNIPSQEARATLVTFPGAVIGDPVIVEHTSLIEAGAVGWHNILLDARILDDGTVAVWIRNFDSSDGTNPPAGTLNVIVFMNEDISP